MAFGRNPGCLILVIRCIWVRFQTFDEAAIETHGLLVQPEHWIGLESQRAAENDTCGRLLYSDPACSPHGFIMIDPGNSFNQPNTGAKNVLGRALLGRVGPILPSETELDR